ncbi:MAG TPA: glycosyltransferase family 39 protein [Oculatellaceae cyanobacterium]|jgi:uncharacterized membrane protein
MDTSEKRLRHYLVLLGIIILGVALRFWHLDFKPLWLDEVITALVTLGHGYDDVPKSEVFGVDQLQQLFTLKKEVSCAVVIQTLINQSTHPPIFFCLLHSWLSFLQANFNNVVWAMRSLPALFGICAIAVVYFLNRIAFSPYAGLLGAAIMAVSPFGVYLSQEARHYTLPVLLISLSLLALIKIQQDLYQQLPPRPLIWLAWGIFNSISCYVHYFCILALIAQIFTLGVMFYRQRRTLADKRWITVAVVTFISIYVSYLPWISIVISHFRRPETNWLKPPHDIAPLYQIFISWLLIFINLPVENQSLRGKFLSSVLILVFVIFLSWQFVKGLSKLSSKPATQASLVTLGSFILFVLLEFLAITYLLKKDITAIARYHFIYFPAMCALLGASLSKLTLLKSKNIFDLNNHLIGQTNSGVRLSDLSTQSLKSNKFRKNFRFNLLFKPPSNRLLNNQLIPANPAFLAIASVSLISSIFVGLNLTFVKPYQPEQVAQKITASSSISKMIVFEYRDTQDLALGLSFMRASFTNDARYFSNKNDLSFAFLPKNANRELFWQQLSQLPNTNKSPLDLWVFSTRRETLPYPSQISLLTKQKCTIDAKSYYQRKKMYQLYLCQ